MADMRLIACRSSQCYMCPAVQYSCQCEIKVTNDQRQFENVRNHRNKNETRLKKHTHISAVIIIRLPAEVWNHTRCAWKHTSRENISVLRNARWRLSRRLFGARGAHWLGRCSIDVRTHAGKHNRRNSVAIACCSISQPGQVSTGCM